MVVPWEDELRGGLKPDRIKLVKALLILIASLIAIPAFAETWTTTDGKTYLDVKVIRVEDDAITVLCKDGGSLIPIFKLSPALQKRFSYDPAKAKIAAEVRAKQDSENAKQLQKEIDLATKQKLQEQVDMAKQRDAALNKATKP